MEDSPIFDDSDTDYMDLEKSQELEMGALLSPSKKTEDKIDIEIIEIAKSSPSTQKKTIASPRISRQLERIGCQGLEGPKNTFLIFRFSCKIF